MIHFLRTGREVGPGFLLGGEETRRLVHHVDAEISPRQFRRIALGTYLDPITIDDHVVPVDGNFPRKLPVHGVVLGQVGVGFRVAEIVDRNDADLIGSATLVQRAQDVASDASVTVDCNLNGHWPSFERGARV